METCMTSSNLFITDFLFCGNKFDGMFFSKMIAWDFFGEVNFSLSVTETMGSNYSRRSLELNCEPDENRE